MGTVRTARVRIEGRVQGVGYRAWLEGEALARAVKGWVRNRRDGSVEALLQGPGERVGEVVRLCERGPPGSRVTRVDAVDEVQDALDGFDVLPTA